MEKTDRPKFAIKKPIAKLSPEEMVIGGDAKDINPSRILKKKPKTFLERLFS
jgi:hypothetical protein